MQVHADDSPRGSPRRITPAQVVGIGLVMASFAWAAWLLRDRPISEEVELLPGTVLPSSELAIVEAAFDRAQLIDHRTEGGRVWVPRTRQSAYMRALVDAEALPREFGSSLRRALEQNSPWQSRAVQEEMLRVAIQEELAHVICSMPGIERAAVLYDGDDRRSGGGLTAGREPTASVNVRTQPDTELEASRVEAIRVLVAASIAGLSAEQVAVTDLRSGRVFVGPLHSPQEAEAGLAATDPALARRVAHERHLADKLRRGLAFIDGAVVDVTVTFGPAVPPRLPAPEPSAATQRVADANAPAEVGDDGPPSPPRPVRLERADPSSPTTILVSLAVPETWLGGSADPNGPRAGLTESKLREHVLALLPPTTRADGRQVALTSYPVASPAPTAAIRSRQVTERVEAPAAGNGTESRTSAEAVSLEAAWQSLLAGNPEAVPREVWLGVIALAAGILGWLVLRPPTSRRRRGLQRESSAEPIDWSGIDGTSRRHAPEASAPGHAAKVAA
jgi:type III secretory pathway lipoprotein EscJ